MATEKQIAFAADLIARHVAEIDAEIARWQRSTTTDAPDSLAYLAEVRAVVAPLALDPNADTEIASFAISTLQRSIGVALTELAQKPKRAAALGASVDPAFARRVYRRGL